MTQVNGTCAELQKLVARPSLPEPASADALQFHEAAAQSRRRIVKPKPLNNKKTKKCQKKSDKGKCLSKFRVALKCADICALDYPTRPVCSVLDLLLPSPKPSVTNAPSTGGATLAMDTETTSFVSVYIPDDMVLPQGVELGMPQ